MKLATCGLLLLIAACGGANESSRDTLTQRQRDSILAQSKIPGARAVGAAQRAADSTSAQIQRANAVATDTNPR